MRLAEAKLAAKLQDQLAEKAAEVEKLKTSIQASDQAKQLAVIEATTRVAKERDRLKADLESAEAQKALGEKALQDKFETQIKDRDDAIERLKYRKARLSTKMVGETLEQRGRLQLPLLHFSRQRKARVARGEAASVSGGCGDARGGGRASGTNLRICST